MTLTNKQLFFITLAACLVLEIGSLLGFFWPIITNILAALVIVLTIIITIKKTTNGFLLLLAELIIGSQGYLLWLGQGNQKLSLRIALWSVVMIIWLVKEINKFVKTKKPTITTANFSYYGPFLLLVISLLVAGVIGLAGHNNLTLILVEAKRWLYILVLVPIVLLFKNKDEEKILVSVAGAALIWLSIKTLFLLYIFSHGLAISEIIYSWTRANLLGEITKLNNGFSRVFLQSQVYAILGFIFSLIILAKETINANKIFSKKIIPYCLTSALFLSVIIISLSRSFWFGLGLGLVFIFILALFLKPNFKQIGQLAISFIRVGVVALIILFITLEFPWPKPLFSFSASLLSDRATTDDAAADSRWALLPIMNQTIIKQPILGYGLGKTLTYKSSDPRVLKKTSDGTYTTNAFEWGWLDLWLKLGLLGLIAYLWLLLTILKKAWQKIKINPYQALGIIASILALIGLNVFTPYLNHPLGFGFLALIMAIL